MATDLSYQKASRIRGTGFADLLSDQLMDAPTIRSAIGRTISLKTQAKIKGIKEKFDPLNIAKFLTGGSSLGPALLGRLTGRSEKDIQYFSGRLRPIREKGTASRIGASPSSGISQDASDMLKKIYYLMQITRESDLQRRDVEMNYEEERKIEAEKRHKELLSVLGGYKGPKVPTATKVEGPSILDSLFGLFASLSKGFENLKAMLAPILEMLNPFLSLLKSGFLTIARGLITAARWLLPILTSPIGVGALIAVLIGSGLWYALDKFAKNMVNYKAITPSQAAEMLARNDPREMKEYGGPEGLKRIIREDTGRARELLEQYNKAETKEDKESVQNAMNALGGLDQVKKIVAEGDIAIPEVTSTSLPQTVPPRPDTAGGTKNMAAAKEWDNKFGEYYTPNGKLKPEYNFGKGSLAPGSTPSEAGAGRGFINPAPPGATQDRLDSATKENLEVNLPRTRPAADTVVNNVNAPEVKNLPQKLMSLNAIAVRNTEPTFLRMIMDSTRVV